LTGTQGVYGHDAEHTDHTEDDDKDAKLAFGYHEGRDSSLSNEARDDQAAFKSKFVLLGVKSPLSEQSRTRRYFGYWQLLTSCAQRMRDPRFQCRDLYGKLGSRRWVRASQPEPETTTR
jgi:hypothetical protein